ncbi:YcjF family protein (plasmid) [Paracoccus sp. TK19116]|uniref:YcjF family protein n=1 Tax=Paracoccus albicereus TaxID=2922394 RepID=A0ABT1MMW1_9RHOB|nr:TIGR01620 family protein [Paracoccus albicereus]MCQ0969124.1 YcjF family protein [Paracoccus albicereus]
MSEDRKRRGPVVLDLGDGPARTPRPDPRPFAGEEPPRTEAPRRERVQNDAGPNPADAAPIDDGAGPLPRPRTMEMVLRLAGRGPSRLTRFFINTGVALFTFLLSVAALNFINNLIARYPLLGWIGVALFALFAIAALGMAIREYRAWARFGVIDAIHRDAGAALAKSDLTGAKSVTDRMLALYGRRTETQWARDRLAERRGDVFDAQTLLGLAETELLAPLDQEARREIEAAARTVAAATALIPLALADVMAALAANLRMIRRMAEIYGGRAGAVGGWRLARTVITHLVATGAVAAGDDLIHTVAGGGMLAKVSRRFGEGVVNGALTARVGIAAMEVCRPLPFIHQPRPKVGNLVSRGLAGLFGRTDETDGRNPPKDGARD